MKLDEFTSGREIVAGFKVGRIKMLPRNGRKPIGLECRIERSYNLIKIFYNYI